MNCVLNSSLVPSEEHCSMLSSSFYISEKPPPDFILPSDMSCKMYHPITIDGIPCDVIDPDMQIKIMDFIKTHDCTDSGNITELSQESLNRFLLIPCVIGILFHNDQIVGTMISVILRVHYSDKESEGLDLLTTYTTFLCIDTSFREKGLAMALIRGIMKEGYVRYGINHGYYMTAEVHHHISSKIESWYRPINIQKAIGAGFTLGTFARKGDRRAAIRQKIAYHIGKPNIIPVKASRSSYEKVLRIFRKHNSKDSNHETCTCTHPHPNMDANTLYLNPTLIEYECMCRCFDVYIVGDDSLFMLFPMDSVISSTQKRVHNAQLALMIGDVLPHALWIASESGYDLLYGWCGSDITHERVINTRGLITTAESHLEFYNTKKLIPNNNMMTPIF